MLFKESFAQAIKRKDHQHDLLLTAVASVNLRVTTVPGLPGDKTPNDHICPQK